MIDPRYEYRQMSEFVVGDTIHRWGKDLKVVKVTQTGNRVTIVYDKGIEESIEDYARSQFMALKRVEEEERGEYDQLGYPVSCHAKGTFRIVENDGGEVYLELTNHKTRYVHTLLIDKDNTKFLLWLYHVADWNANKSYNDWLASIVEEKDDSEKPE